MKKFLCLFLLVTMLVIPATMNVSAFPFGVDADLCIFDEEGQCYEDGYPNIHIFENIDIAVKAFGVYGNERIPDELLDAVLNSAEEGEYFVAFDVFNQENDNRYPEIESINFIIDNQRIGGRGNSSKIGKDYRVCFIGEDLSVTEIENCITDQEDYYVEGTLEALGKYVMYFNPEVCDITFYAGERIYVTDEEDEEWPRWVNKEECIYHKIEGLKRNDTYEFPNVPQREGYIFGGWLSRSHQYFFEYEDYERKGRGDDEFFAYWIPEEDFEALEVKTKALDAIRPGGEDGKKVRITINQGHFYEYMFPAEWVEEYENEEDEEYKEQLFEYWKSQWQVIGSEEILIEKVELVDEKTIELTLMGNSANTEASYELGFSFCSGVIDISDEEHKIRQDIGVKQLVQLNEKGLVKTMYTTDNTVKIRKKSSGGGGASTVLVSFETNGGEKQDNRRYAWGEKAELPVPVKEGFVFGGWYTDSGLTQKADTSFKKSATLYAKWVPENKEENQLIMYVGKDSAKAFGKEISGVAPVMESGRLYIPLRFVAESFGGKVGWNNDTRQITVTYLDNSALIDLKNMSASANGFMVNVEGELFVINSEGRTYISADFVNKILGNIITFDAKTNMIIIEK